MNSGNPVSGVGLGFRRDLIPQLRSCENLDDIDFFEIAPENWIGLGGRFARDLRDFTERFPFTCHGLSLSIGSTDALDMELLNRIKQFMGEHNIQLYTEHLSWCSHDGHLYDLLPIPCTEEAIKWVVERIQRSQDCLGMQIGVENASYYLAPPGAEMSEEVFISEIVKRSGCYLHLDVNNIYVNSQNFNFDPHAYLKALPLEYVGYMHVAGHYREDSGLIVDTHGADIIDPVWDLLCHTYQTFVTNNICGLDGRDISDIPICLERDFNYPPMNSLLSEVRQIRSIQSDAATVKTNTSVAHTASMR